MGATGPTHTQPLKREKAIEVGAEILGETFIYTVAATFILFEYWRSGQKEAALEAEQDRDIDTLKDRLKHLEDMLTHLQERLEDKKNKS